MLDEQENRILNRATDVLIDEFEPRDAIPFMSSRFVFDDSQQRLIISYPRRLNRVLEFVRQYRLSAQSLSHLIIFCKQRGLIHLQNMLEKSTSPFRSVGNELNDTNYSLLTDSNLPRSIDVSVKRDGLMRRLCDLLIENAKKESSFWIVVHGITGCGKTCLVIDTLRMFSLELTQYFDSVIWIHDGRTNPSQLPKLYADFVVFASPHSVELKEQESISNLQVMVRNALVHRPNSLIVLDDVLLIECIRWFDDIGCRILATSINSQIFRVVRGSLTFEYIKGFSSDQIESLFRVNNIENASRSIVCQFFEVTGGLPSMTNILVDLCMNDLERLKWMLESMINKPLKFFDCITPYWCSNIEIAFWRVYNMLGSSQKVFLQSLSLFPSNVFIPLEAIAYVSTTDVAGRQDIYYVAQQRLEDLVAWNLIEQSQTVIGGRVEMEYMIHPLLSNFLITGVIESQETLRQDMYTLVCNIEVMSYSASAGVMSGRCKRRYDFFIQYRHWFEYRRDLYYARIANSNRKASSNSFRNFPCHVM